jgi:glycosyltransferase involved in cell wall biosynthesis
VRILFIIPTLDRHGAEKQLSLLAPGLARKGFDVHVCALTRGGPYEQLLRAAGISVTVLGKRGKLDPRTFWRLKRVIAAFQPEVVQTMIFAANAYGRAAAIAAGVPRVFGGERCVDPWKRWHQLAIDRYLAKRSEAIVVNSQGIADFYASKGIAADKFRVIPNGIGPISSSDCTRAQLLAELGLPQGARLIGAVNRLWPQKRIKDVIWAADLLKVVRDDVHLLVIGDGPHKARLLRYRDQVQIADRVHFLGARDDVPRLMAHFDCLWLASAYEGQSNAIMEAMACGVPVVASDIPGNRDLVVHGETGYLTPIGDRAAIARHTNRLLDDSALAERLGRAGQMRIAQEFSVDKMVSAYAALYRNGPSTAASR